MARRHESPGSGAKGIGAATVKLFEQAGARVAVLDVETGRAHPKQRH